MPKAALDRIHSHPPGSTRRLTLGADKSHDSADLVRDLRQACVAPHVARKARRSALDGRTPRHERYAKSQRSRKRIEEAFGWPKPSAAWPRPSIAASSACDLASS